MGKDARLADVWHRERMTTRHCGTHVPDALRGNLAASTCNLVVDTQGRHVGDHKAVYSVPRLGRVTFRWKTGWRKIQPPVVELPSIAGSVLNPRRSARLDSA